MKYLFIPVILFLSFNSNVNAQQILLAKDTICTGNPIQFSISTAPSINTVEWDFNNDGFFDDFLGLSGTYTITSSLDSTIIWARIIYQNQSIQIVSKKIVLLQIPKINIPLINICQYSSIKIDNSYEKNYTSYTKNFLLDNVALSANDSTFEFSKVGKHTVYYFIQLEDGCFNSFNGSFNVNPNPSISLDSTSVHCSSDTSYIKISENNGVSVYKYVWQTVQDSSIYFGTNLLAKKFNKSGIYDTKLMAVTSNGCLDTLGITLKIPQSKVLKINSPNDSLIISGIALTLSVSSIFQSIVWGNGYVGNSITVSQPGTYTVSAKDSIGCLLKDTIVLKEVTSKLELLNNTITMNNDGVNDYFKIKNIELYKTLTMNIYNRYNQLVYKNENYDNSFNGYVDGKGLDEGSYPYIILCEGVKYVGDLTILK